MHLVAVDGCLVKHARESDKSQLRMLVAWEDLRNLLFQTSQIERERRRGCSDVGWVATDGQMLLWRDGSQTWLEDQADGGAVT